MGFISQNLLRLFLLCLVGNDNKKLFVIFEERKRKIMYSKCKEEVLELISISESNQGKMHIITVFDDPYKV